MKIKDLFQNPKIIAVVGDVNSGKSLLLYWMIKELQREGKFNLYTYGLRKEIKNSTEIHSIAELESIKNSIIAIDEITNLFDFADRTKKKQIEATFRLIHHNNNILLMVGVCENFHKFIAGKVSAIFYKKSTLDDFINGSKVKRIIEEYSGYERGMNVLSLENNEAIVFDGNHYHKIEFPYISEFDTKKDNEEIVKKNVEENVGKTLRKKI